MSKQPNDSPLSPDGTGNGKRSMFSSIKRALSNSGKGNKDKRAGTAPSDDVDSKAHEAGLANTNPFVEPPPAYSPTVPESSGQSALRSATGSSFRSPTASTSGDSNDKFRFLSQFDTAFLIDDSGSMASRDDGFLSRWEQTRDVIKQIVPICMQYDRDGVDIYFLNDPYDIFRNHNDREQCWSQEGIREEGKASHVYHNVTDAEIVSRVFNGREPRQTTPTGRRLDEILSSYVACYQTRERNQQELPKPLNIIVITDGQATDREHLMASLIKHAQKLDQIGAPYHQVGVQFFQVGKDNGAAGFLRELDDDLVKIRSRSRMEQGNQSQELRDIVDCVTYDELSKSGYPPLSADTVLKIILGAVNKHLDQQRIRRGKLSNDRRV